MDSNTKELVAVATSVAGHCQPCFRHHLGRAVELGINPADIQEAIDLAERISQVGDQRMAEFVKETLGERKKEENQ